MMSVTHNKANNKAIGGCSGFVIVIFNETYPPVILNGAAKQLHFLLVDLVKKGYNQSASPCLFDIFLSSFGVRRMPKFQLKQDLKRYLGMMKTTRKKKFE